MFRWATISGPVMGVVNVTPDSFSDGGRFDAPEAAITHATTLAAAGAAVLDIGGESTRPGAAPVDEATELRRVIPVAGHFLPREAPEAVVAAIKELGGG